MGYDVLDDEGFEQSPPTTAVLGISVFRVRREAAYACGIAEGEGCIGDVTEIKRNPVKWTKWFRRKHSFATTNHIRAALMYTPIVSRKTKHRTRDGFRPVCERPAGRGSRVRELRRLYATDENVSKNE